MTETPLKLNERLVIIHLHTHMVTPINTTGRFYCQCKLTFIFIGYCWKTVSRGYFPGDNVIMKRYFKSTSQTQICYYFLWTLKLTKYHFKHSSWAYLYEPPISAFMWHTCHLAPEGITSSFVTVQCSHSTNRKNTFQNYLTTKLRTSQKPLRCCWYLIYFACRIQILWLWKFEI